MKIYCLFLFLSFISTHTWAKIRNGYAAQIESARSSLKALYSLIFFDPELEASDRRVINSKIKTLEDYVLMYELTERILFQFREIGPELYEEIDNLTDRKGRVTDVCVKMTNSVEAKFNAYGITNVDALDDDKDGYESEYGPNTVSIKIWNVDRALWVLAHEFGHAKYQVHNLATYMEYYQRSYTDDFLRKSNYIGHAFSDPSGQNAKAFERSFRKSYTAYTRNAIARVEFPSVLVERIRRKIQSDKRTYSAVASSEM